VLRRLDLVGYSYELLLESVLAGRVQHLGANLSGIRTPYDEDELFPLPGFARVEVKVVYGVSTVVRGQLLDELVVRLRARRHRLLHLDLLQIRRDPHLNVRVLVADLDIVELSHHRILHGYS